jgi:hypothetical protein
MAPVTRSRSGEEAASQPTPGLRAVVRQAVAMAYKAVVTVAQGAMNTIMVAALAGMRDGGIGGRLRQVGDGYLTYATLEGDLRTARRSNSCGADSRPQTAGSEPSYAERHALREAAAAAIGTVPLS